MRPHLLLSVPTDGSSLDCQDKGSRAGARTTERSIGVQSLVVPAGEKGESTAGQPDGDNVTTSVHCVGLDTHFDTGTNGQWSRRVEEVKRDSNG